MSLKPRISHYRHTGHHLPHEHTSYAVLALMLLALGLGLFGLTRKTAAEPIGISAVVAAPPVTNPATITKPQRNQHFTSTPIDIEGTCQAGTLVKLFDNGVFTGSAICVGKSTFSFQADLYVGRNDLVIRQYNANDQPGPDSEPVSVYYDLSNEQAGGIASNGGQLVLISSNQYKGTMINQELTWPLQIHGGIGPYTVSWDWGDGQVDSIMRADAGSFSQKHIYTKKGTDYKSTFPLLIKVTDSMGQTAFLQLVTIVNSNKNPILPASLEDGTLIAWPLWIMAVLVVISFWLGEQREKAVLRKQARLARPGSQP